MRLFKLVPMVGICGISLLSSSAMAGLWVKTCATEQQLCLDATAANGMVQVSKCNPSLKAQEWEQNSPWTKYLQNAFDGFNQPCLDMSSETAVITSECADWKKAQQWKFADNGQVGPIQNQFWNDGEQCLVVDSDGQTVTVAKCNGENSQNWYWVNVDDKTPCPTEDSKMKLPTPAQPVMNLPNQTQPVMKLPENETPENGE